MNIKRVDYIVAVERSFKEGYEKGAKEGYEKAAREFKQSILSRRLDCIEKASDALLSVTEMAARIATAAQMIDKY